MKTAPATAIFTTATLAAAIPPQGPSRQEQPLLITPLKTIYKGAEQPSTKKRSFKPVESAPPVERAVKPALKALGNLHQPK